VDPYRCQGHWCPSRSLGRRRSSSRRKPGTPYGFTKAGSAARRFLLLWTRTGAKGTGVLHAV